MAKITYPDKTTGSYYTGAEATEVKSVVNENDDAATLFVEAWSTSIRADKKRTHSTPQTMSGDMTLTTDETNAVLGFGETKKIIGDGSVLSIVGGVYPANQSAFITKAGTQYLLIFMWDGTVFQGSIDTITDEDFPSSIILMEDDFAGTTIDTGKWTETDPDGYISQNEKILFNYGGSASNRGHYITSVLDSPTISAIQATKANNDSDHASWLQFWDGTQQNEITIGTQTANRNLVRLIIRKGDASVYDENVAISNDNTFKILKDGDDISFYYLSAPNTWTIMNPTTNPETVTAMPTLKAGIIGSSTPNVGTADVDNFYMTNADYSTSVPI